MIQVLVIEDNPTAQRGYKAVLEVSGVDVVHQASTLDEARRLFGQYKHELNGIILDGRLSDEGIQPTLGFIVEIKKDYSGPLIAASSDPVFLQKMKAAGCTHAPGKNASAELLLELLNLS